MGVRGFICLPVQSAMRKESAFGQKFGQAPIRRLNANYAVN
jgi:hypothetical protein